jgi:hypothetical protein
MSKKSKRQSRKRAAPSSGKTSKANRVAHSMEFNPDYSDTIKDLKRIGILAGTFFAVLVGLSFFLR